MAATITDQMVMEEIQFTMIETPDLGQTWPSGVWTTAEVVGYLNQRQQQFLKDTHFQVGIVLIEVDGTTTLIAMPDDWIATVRVLWSGLTTTVAGDDDEDTGEDAADAQAFRMSIMGFLGVDIGRLRPMPDGDISTGDRLALLPLVSGTAGGGSSSSGDTTITADASIELTRSDSWEADHGIPTWPYTAAKPKIYYDSGGPTGYMRIAPFPATAGTLTLYYVPLAAVLDATGEVITIPNEFTPTLKYGAMADMFGKVGRGHDMSRAEYCRQRYELGIEIANMMLAGWQ